MAISGHLSGCRTGINIHTMSATEARIKLYVDYISQPSRTVLAFCRMSNLSVEVTEIRVAKLQHLTERYLRVNPMHKVPALVDSAAGVSLGESHAIISYLMRKYSLEQQWGCGTEALRTRVEEYLHYHHLNTRKCAMVLYSEVFARLYPVSQKSGPKGDTLRQEVNEVLDFIEQQYFRDSCFMIGQVLTPADLAAYFQILSLVVVEFQLGGWPRIERWMQVVGREEGVKESNRAFLQLVPKLKLPKPAL